MIPPCLCHLDRWVSIYFHTRTFSLPPQVGQVLEGSGTRSKFPFLLRFIGYSCICAERLFRALEDDLWGTLEWKISRQALNFFYMHCNPLQGQYRARTGFSLCSFCTQGKPCFHYRDGFSVWFVCSSLSMYIPVLWLKCFTQWVATMLCSVFHTHWNYLERWIRSRKQSPKFEPAILCTFLWFNLDDKLAH